MSKGYASSYRIVLLSTGLFVCFGALALRLVWLHVVNRDELIRGIDKVRRQVIVETARRGDIYDTNGVTLATSRPMRVLGVDPTALRPQDENKWPELARLIGMPEDELRRIFTTKYRTVEPKATPAAEASVVFKLDGVNGETNAPSEKSEAATVALSIPGLPTPAAKEAKVEQPDDVELDAAADAKGRRLIQWAKLREDVSEDLYQEILKLGIRGLTGDRAYKRVYPSNQLASHIVGFVNKAQEPAAGIEAVYDFYLSGKNGWRVGEKDGRGRELAQYRTREVPKVDGYNITLTLDMLVQDIIEQELALIAEKFTPVKASIIVSDPRTGFILGMANYPSFDLNAYNKVPKEEAGRMRNAAVADIYEPGSVFKIVAASAAIEERLVTPRELFDCALTHAIVRGTTVKLPAEDHRMGNLTVAEIISHSSNKGAAQLAMRVGEEKFHDYARKFGFGRRLGFPVGAEEAGILNNYKGWVPIDITRIAMGHSVSATVLQMHQAMSVIASGGVLLKPQIIHKVSDPSGDMVYQFSREELHRVISTQTAAAVASMLTGVVAPKMGGEVAAIPGFDVAGKTGTTQKLIYETMPDGKERPIGYSNKHHVGSFVGFFPAGDPQVVISVVVDEAKVTTPPYTAYGRVVAAPSFKRIGERLIPILKIKSHNPSARPGLIASNEGGRR